jgi:RNA polymerase sigma factor for flagellar operon FliA
MLSKLGQWFRFPAQAAPKPGASSRRAVAEARGDAVPRKSRSRKPVAPRSGERPALMGKATIQAFPTFAGLELPQITVVQDDAAAEAACAALRAAGTVGFDTESRPTFNKGETPQGPHLIQLSTDRHAYLFPVRGPMPAALQSLLTAREVTKVGFDLRSDLAMLEGNCGLRCAGIEDLVTLFRRAGYRNTVGAVQAVALLFRQQYRKSKSAKMSNWAAPRLSDSQQRYAANDAYVALKVYQALQAKARQH